jgi:ribosome-binding protein aMBF1 (putative translation factor)
MAHYCRICGRYRANEKFSGKGHATHVCKDCMKLPKVERQHIEERDEISRFLNQSNISGKNLARLQRLTASSDKEVARMAKLVLEIGKLHPHKRRRIQFLVRERKDLLTQLEEIGLIEMFEPF